MGMTTTAAALASPVFTADDYTLQITVPDLDSEPYVTLAAPDGEVLVVPNRFLGVLSRQSMQMQGQARQMLDDAWRSQARLWEDSRLMAFGPRGVGPDARMYALANRGAWDETEGVPYLEWRPLTGPESPAGWRLALSGAAQVSVSFARWDDADALAGLIESMGDAESLMTMAGITNPDVIAHLSARMTAVSLRSARALPRIDLPKARKILTDAGLAEPSERRSRDNHAAATMRLLAVRVGGTRVPVAVAVNPPRVPAGTPSLSEDEARGMNYQQKQQRLEEVRAPSRERWLSRARTALESAGWRILELPRPRQPWGYNQMDCLWATRIDAETWSGVSAAATGEARSLEMSRGAVL